MLKCKYKNDAYLRRRVQNKELKRRTYASLVANLLMMKKKQKRKSLRKEKGNKKKIFAKFPLSTIKTICHNHHHKYRFHKKKIVVFSLK